LIKIKCGGDHLWFAYNKRNFRMRLITLKSAGWTVVLLASMTLAHAGPCSSEIAQTQGRIDAALEQVVAAGRTGPQVTHSTHVQPTPRSIGAAEAQLGGLAPEKIDAVRQAMVRARAADAADDKAACEEALADAKRQLGP
jgi:hypothetical protein